LHLISSLSAHLGGQTGLALRGGQSCFGRLASLLLLPLLVARALLVSLGVLRSTLRVHQIQSQQLLPAASAAS
jgi:hypothetical protein